MNCESQCQCCSHRDLNSWVIQMKPEISPLTDVRESHWVPLQRVLSYWVLHPEKHLYRQGREQLVPCTLSSAVLALVHRRHMLGCVQADRSQLTHILEQQGNGQSTGGLPSPSLLARLLESQHKPAIEWATQGFSYPSKGLKGSSVPYFGLWQICLFFAYLPILLQICK